MAPMRAMNGVFSLLSNICRQFLVGLARLAGGSSRESVSTLVETIPRSRPIARMGRQAAVAAPRPVTHAPNTRGGAAFRRREAISFAGGHLRSYRYLRLAARVLWQSLNEASRGQTITGSCETLVSSYRALHCTISSRRGLPTISTVTGI